MTPRYTVLTLLVSLLTAITMTGAAFGETLYIAAKSAQLRSGKTSMDPVVATLKLGEPLEVMKRDTRWLEVRTTKGVTGFAVGDRDWRRVGLVVNGDRRAEVAQGGGAGGIGQPFGQRQEPGDRKSTRLNSSHT